MKATADPLEAPALDEMVDSMDDSHMSANDRLVVQMQVAGDFKRQTRLVSYQATGRTDHGTFPWPAKCIADVDGMLCVTQDVVRNAQTYSHYVGGDLIIVDERIPLFRRPFPIVAVGKQRDGRLYDVCGKDNRVQMYESRANKLVSWDFFDAMHRPDTIQMGPTGAVLVSSTRIKKLGGNSLVDNGHMQFGSGTVAGDQLFMKCHYDGNKSLVPLLKLDLANEGRLPSVIHAIPAAKPYDRFYVDAIRVSPFNGIYYQQKTDEAPDEIRVVRREQSAHSVLRMKKGYSIANFAVFDGTTLKS